MSSKRVLSQLLFLAAVAVATLNAQTCPDIPPLSVVAEETGVAPELMPSGGGVLEHILWPVTDDFLQSRYAEAHQLHVRRPKVSATHFENVFGIKPDSLELLLQLQDAVQGEAVLSNPHTGQSQARCETAREGMDDVSANFTKTLPLHMAYLNGATLICNLVPA